MNFEEFMNYTSPDTDDSGVKYVLDVRKTDEIEYLVRYEDPKYEYDEWVKASDLTCYKKIIDFYDGRNPKNIEKNPRPENPNQKNIQVDVNDEFKIYDVTLVNNEVMLTVHIPGTPGTVLKKSDDSELREKYMEQIVQYYEKSCFGNN